MIPHLHYEGCTCLKIDHPAGTVFLDEQTMQRARLHEILTEKRESHESIL